MSPIAAQAYGRGSFRSLVVFPPKQCTDGVFKVSLTEPDDEANEHKKSPRLLILLERPSVYFGSSGINQDRLYFCQQKEKPETERNLKCQ